MKGYSGVLLESIIEKDVKGFFQHVSAKIDSREGPDANTLGFLAPSDKRGASGRSDKDQGRDVEAIPAVAYYSHWQSAVLLNAPAHIAKRTWLVLGEAESASSSTLFDSWSSTSARWLHRPKLAAAEDHTVLNAGSHVAFNTHTQTQTHTHTHTHTRTTRDQRDTRSNSTPSCTPGSTLESTLDPVFPHLGRFPKTTGADPSRVLDLSFGEKHSILIDASHRIFVWGQNGRHGRLGGASKRACETEPSLLPLSALGASSPSRAAHSQHFSSLLLNAGVGSGNSGDTCVSSTGDSVRPCDTPFGPGPLPGRPQPGNSTCRDALGSNDRDSIDCYGAGGAVDASTDRRAILMGRRNSRERRATNEELRWQPKRVIAGRDHSVCLTAGGEVLTWGSDEKGQLGRIAVPQASSTAPAALNANALVGGSGGGNGGGGGGSVGEVTFRASMRSQIVAVASGSDHCLALSRNGVVAAWGSNGYWQCADAGGLSSCVRTPKEISFQLQHVPSQSEAGGFPIHLIAAGANSSAAAHVSFPTTTLFVFGGSLGESMQKVFLPEEGKERGGGGGGGSWPPLNASATERTNDPLKAGGGSSRVGNSFWIGEARPPLPALKSMCFGGVEARFLALLSWEGRVYIVDTHGPRPLSAEPVPILRDIEDLAFNEIELFARHKSGVVFVVGKFPTQIPPEEIGNGGVKGGRSNLTFSPRLQLSQLNQRETKQPQLSGPKLISVLRQALDVSAMRVSPRGLALEVVTLLPDPQFVFTRFAAQLNYHWLPDTRPAALATGLTGLTGLTGPTTCTTVPRNSLGKDNNEKGENTPQRRQSCCISEISDLRKVRHVPLRFLVSFQLARLVDIGNVLSLVQSAMDAEGQEALLSYCLLWICLNLRRCLISTKPKHTSVLTALAADPKLHSCVALVMAYTGALLLFPRRSLEFWPLLAADRLSARQLLHIGSKAELCAVITEREKSFKARKEADTGPLALYGDFLASDEEPEVEAKADIGDGATGRRKAFPVGKVKQEGAIRGGKAGDEVSSPLSTGVKSTQSSAAVQPLLIPLIKSQPPPNSQSKPATQPRPVKSLVSGSQASGSLARALEAKPSTPVSRSNSPNRARRKRQKGRRATETLPGDPSGPPPWLEGSRFAAMDAKASACLASAVPLDAQSLQILQLPPAVTPMVAQARPAVTLAGAVAEADIGHDDGADELADETVNPVSSHFDGHPLRNADLGDRLTHIAQRDSVRSMASYLQTNDGRGDFQDPVDVQLTEDLDLTGPQVSNAWGLKPSLKSPTSNKHVAQDTQGVHGAQRRDFSESRGRLAEVEDWAKVQVPGRADFGSGPPLGGALPDFPDLKAASTTPQPGRRQSFSKLSSEFFAPGASRSSSLRSSAPRRQWVTCAGSTQAEAAEDPKRELEALGPAVLSVRERAVAFQQAASATATSSAPPQNHGGAGGARGSSVRTRTIRPLASAATDDAGSSGWGRSWRQNGRQSGGVSVATAHVGPLASQPRATTHATARSNSGLSGGLGVAGNVGRSTGSERRNTGALGSVGPEGAMGMNAVTRAPQGAHRPQSSPWRSNDAIDMGSGGRVKEKPTNIQEIISEQLHEQVHFQAALEKIRLMEEEEERARNQEAFKKSRVRRAGLRDQTAHAQSSSHSQQLTQIKTGEDANERSRSKRATQRNATHNRSPPSQRETVCASVCARRPPPGNTNPGGTNAVENVCKSTSGRHRNQASCRLGEGKAGSRRSRKPLGLVEDHRPVRENGRPLEIDRLPHASRRFLGAPNAGRQQGRTVESTTGEMDRTHASDDVRTTAKSMRAVDSAGSRVLHSNELDRSVD